MDKDVPCLARKARLKGSNGDFAGGHAILDEAELLVAGNVEDSARCQIERGRLFHSAGAKAQSVLYFRRAWDLARQAQAHSLAVDAAHMMAIASPLAEAEAWTRQALDYIAAYPTAEHWRGPLHNNLGWSYFDAARYAEAMAQFEKALGIYSALGHPAPIRIARYTIVRTLRAQGRLEEAIDLAEAVIAEADICGDNAPYVCEELAELYHAKGDKELAGDYAGRALVILSRDKAFTSGEPARHRRLRDLAGEAHLEIRA